MPRPKKDSKNINANIDSKIYEKMIEYAKKSKLTKTAVLELALEEYLKNK